jgi:hypothetical protein
MRATDAVGGAGDEVQGAAALDPVELVLLVLEAEVADGSYEADPADIACGQCAQHLDRRARHPDSTGERARVQHPGLQPTIFLAANLTSPAMRAWVEARDLTLVTAAQSWRVGGALFLPLGLHGLLPLEFALPAGLGDVLDPRPAPQHPASSPISSTRR